MAKYDEQPGLGALLVFKEGVTERDARRALARLDGMVEIGGCESSEELLREFDRQYGGPVWYIP